METAVENALRFWPEPVWAPGPFEKVELRDFDLTETENPMTEDRLALAELSAKSGDPDFLRTIAESVCPETLFSSVLRESPGFHFWPQAACVRRQRP